MQARVSVKLLARLEALPKMVRDIAWKGQLRMCQRYRHLVAAGKAKVVVITAIAREMAGFIWAFLHVVDAAAGPRRGRAVRAAGRDDGGGVRRILPDRPPHRLAAAADRIAA